MVLSQHTLSRLSSNDFLSISMLINNTHEGAMRHKVTYKACLKSSYDFFKEAMCALYKCEILAGSRNFRPVETDMIMNFLPRTNIEVEDIEDNSKHCFKFLSIGV